MRSVVRRRVNDEARPIAGQRGSTAAACAGSASKGPVSIDVHAAFIPRIAVDRSRSSVRRWALFHQAHELGRETAKALQDLSNRQRWPGGCRRHLRKDLVDALRVKPPLVDEELVCRLDEQP